ncbi:PAS domain-containing protein [Oceaniglobus roseus]|uniref:PAS domain-containing protein n=1 Tax=Oceaniglobus roseus TaxID=1737570 RepID=UPI0012FFD53B|nr:PAS domain-containing protein [Kandeliimicrobium roseum]
MTQDEHASGRVVPLHGGALALADCFGTLRAYWQGLCRGRIMPLRAEVDPRGIADVLDRTFLLERVAPGVARFRLAGMHVADLMGMEVRGMPVSCFMLPEARAAFAEAVEAVFEAPAEVDLWLSGPPRLVGAASVARMLLLPLRDHEGEVTRAVGCLSATGLRGTPPHRFRITADNRRGLTGYAHLAQTPLPAPRRPELTLVPRGD